MAGTSLEAVRSNVGDSISRMTMQQRITLGGAFAAIVVVLFAISRFAGQTPMETLYADLASPEERADLARKAADHAGIIALPALARWFREEESSMARVGIHEALAEVGVPSRAYFEPVHRQPYLKNRGIDLETPLPATDDIAQRTVALPFHNHMTRDEVDRVANACRDALSR